MSMYNLLFGRNPFAPVILATLGWSHDDVPRFRDAFISEGRIAVYTRMGGGNRGHWESEDHEPGPDCPCPGCRAQFVLAGHPNHISNQDDDFDSTYATYYFSFPEAHGELLERLNGDEPFNPDQRWADMIERVKNGDVPQQAREPLEKLVKAIMAAVTPAETKP